MTEDSRTYKILVQRQDVPDQWLTVAVSEFRDVASAEAAVERFIDSWRSRPDPEYPIG